MLDIQNIHNQRQDRDAKPCGIDEGNNGRLKGKERKDQQGDKRLCDEDIEYQTGDGQLAIFLAYIYGREDQWEKGKQCREQGENKGKYHGGDSDTDGNQADEGERVLRRFARHLHVLYTVKENDGEQGGRDKEDRIANDGNDMARGELCFHGGVLLRNFVIPR
jgi:hypothetical protein